MRGGLALALIGAAWAVAAHADAIDCKRLETLTAETMIGVHKTHALDLGPLDARDKYRQFKLARASGDEAAAVRAGDAYLDAIRRRMGADSAVETRVLKDYADELKGLEPDQQHELAVLVKGMEEAEHPRKDIVAAVHEALDVSCKCGVCSK